MGETEQSEAVPPVPLCSSLAPGDIVARAVSAPVGALVDQWGRVHPIGRLTAIGRDPDNTDLVLAHHSVSRSHAVLRFVGPGKFLVSDQSSTNGTFVGGLRATGDLTAATGQLLVLGEVSLRLAPAPALRVGRPNLRSSGTRRGGSTTLASERWSLCETNGAPTARHGDRRVTLSPEQRCCLRALIDARSRPPSRDLPQMHGYVRSVDLLPTGGCAPQSGEIAVRTTIRRLRATFASIGLDDMIHEHERFGYRLRVLPVDEGD